MVRDTNISNEKIADNNTNVDGVTLDFETAYEADDPNIKNDQDAAMDNFFYKSIADRLAYQGKVFGIFEFSNRGFGPTDLTSMGPNGLALFSAYDVTGFRAPNNGENGGAQYNQAMIIKGAPTLNNFGRNILPSSFLDKAGYGENYQLTAAQSKFYSNFFWNDLNCRNS